MAAKWPPRLQRRHEPGPGFRYGEPNFSEHEKAVREAGYPWVRTNPLIPTWMTPGPDQRPPAESPDRLNAHGHHGVNTHLIVSGDLTIRKVTKFHGQTAIPALTISTDPGSPKEAAAVGNEMYWGTTERGCTFVEGHRCLSPATANRFMDRGTLKWVDDEGYELSRSQQNYIKNQLQGAIFTWDALQRRASIRFPDHNSTTEILERWFKREWECDQSRNGPLLAVRYPGDDRHVPINRPSSDEAQGFDWSSVFPWWFLSLAYGFADLMPMKWPGKPAFTGFLSMAVIAIILGLALKTVWQCWQYQVVR